MMLAFGLTLLALLFGSAVSRAAEGSIQITDFGLEHLSDAIRVRVAATAQGAVEIGSYGIRLAAPVADKTFSLPGFHVDSQGWVRLGPPPGLLMDNGPFDHEPAENVVTLVIPTKGWPDGQYNLVLFVSNRPAPGDYIDDQRYFTFSVASGRPVEYVPQYEEYPDKTDVVIYKQAGRYTPFPTLIQLEDGTLLARFTAQFRASHIDGRGDTMVVESHDGGLTWNPTTRPYLDPKWLLRDDGRTKIYVRAHAQGWIHVDESERAAHVARGAVVHDVSAGRIAYLGSGAVRLMSTNGLAWVQDPIPTLDLPGLGLMNHHQEASYLVTSGGLRMVAIYGRRTASAPDEVFLLRSEDGFTWDFSSLAPPTATGMGFNESALVEAANGDIIILMRTQPEGYLYQARSTDGGRTWSEPEQTPMWGHPPHLLRLSNGDLLATYGYRRPPMGVRAAISRDNGVTWDIENEIVLRADAAPRSGDVGYPITVELENGELFTIYYITLDDGITHVAGTRWRLP